MASQLDSVILWSDAVEQFTEMILPMVQQQHERDGEPDIVARSEAWSNYIDALHSDEVISDWQAQNWSHHPCAD